MEVNTKFCNFKRLQIVKVSFLVAKTSRYERTYLLPLYAKVFKTSSKPMYEHSIGLKINPFCIVLNFHIVKSFELDLVGVVANVIYPYELLTYPVPG